MTQAPPGRQTAPGALSHTAASLQQDRLISTQLAGIGSAQLVRKPTPRASKAARCQACRTCQEKCESGSKASSHSRPTSSGAHPGQ